MGWIYGLTIFFGAALLFLVEPMVAKMVLPLLGGSPSVWNACMVFYQAALLAGYAYAHALSSRLRPRWQVAVHLPLVAGAVAFLPVGIAGRPQAGDSPVAWLMGALALSIGVPFLVLSTTGPLLQRWFASTSHRDAADPYFLYAASNLGSLVALLAYPLLIEPRLELRLAEAMGQGGGGGLLSQNALWSAAYAVYALLCAGCAFLMLRHRATPAPGLGPRGEAPEIPASRRLLWLALAMVPSSALLGTTQYLTTDIAAIPLLWVAPLAVYLVTFVLAFSRKTRIPPSVWSLALAVLVVAVAASLWLPYWFGFRAAPWRAVALHLLTLLAVGMVCHGRLAASRPPAERLTEYYLWVALGGALGGIFNALLAPVIFRTVVEYPLALFFACCLRPDGSVRPGDRRTRSRVLDLVFPAALALAVAGLALLTVRSAAGGAKLSPWIVVGLPSLACLFLVRRPLRFALGVGVLLVAGWTMVQATGQRLKVERTFFGVHQVLRQGSPTVQMMGPAGQMETYDGRFHALVHGTTKHGSQFVDERLRSLPTGYYHPSNPIGLVFRTLARDPRLDAVAVVGLGAGSLSAYGRPGQTMTFYEIDPAVLRIARDPRLFTYLRDSRARVDVVIGDGRLGLAAAPAGAYGMIVLDAFTSDAIPVHLMTREAIRLCTEKLRPDGILALHLTNEYLDLVPVVDAIASDLGLAGLVMEGLPTTRREMVERMAPSTWAVLARDRAALASLSSDSRWRALPLEPGRSPRRTFLWTDSFSNVLGVLR